MSGQHTSAERQRSHRAGQRKIVHYCSCGLAPRGNAAWWSHCNAHPDHQPITASQWLATRNAPEWLATARSAPGATP